MAQDYDAGGMLRRPSEARTDTGDAGRSDDGGVVAVTAGLFTLGAYLARNPSGGAAARP